MHDQDSIQLDKAIAEHGAFTVANRMMARLEYLTTALKKKVDESKEDDLVSALHTFKSLGDLWDKFNDLKKEYNALYDQMSLYQIPDMMKDAGVKTINVEGVGRVTVSYRFSCSMLDKEAGFEWLEESGHGDLIQRTVNFQTLSAFAKNMIQEEGKDLPEEIFKVGTIPYTSVTKVK